MTVTDIPDPSISAEAISDEIGLDLSYFTDESERNFLHIPLALGYLLLKWFAEGLVKGAGEAEGVPKLGRRVRRLFGPRKQTAEADEAVKKELAEQTQAALDKARQKLAGSSADDVARAADAYEQALVGYLADTGMPSRDAIRIAQRVRAEAGLQLRLPPKAKPA
jgi:hypothetical protein